ncbi:hypothetical protein L6R52_21990 [Myxococcota bacterium]|nr:hypothetical protein [Myxococcota bacterium]
MGINFGLPTFNRLSPTTAALRDAPSTQDPVALVRGLFERAAAGGAVDPAILRAVLARLDPATLGQLARALMPDGLPGMNTSSFVNSGKSASPDYSKLLGHAKNDGLRGTTGDSPWSSCFPQELATTFSSACNTKPAWGCVPEAPGCDHGELSCDEPSAPIGPEKPDATKSGKTFDVWFEHKDGQKTKQRSPIVLDLNGNGRPDLTGDVKVENGRWVAKGGGKVDFDIDPTKRSWKTKSVARRPGSGAPAVPGGTTKIFDREGKLVAEGLSVRDGLKRGKKEHPEGRVEVYDASGTLVGELKRDDVKGKPMYHWGNRKDAERTEWMAPGGGDALLAWDVDGNGKIDGSKELFGEFDVDGTKKFANGYEKLAAHFDENRDGTIDTAELARAQQKGVRVWRDVNGDAVTDAGELTNLDEHGVRALSVQVDATDMSSTFDRT